MHLKCKLDLDGHWAPIRVIYAGTGASFYVTEHDFYFLELEAL